MLLNHIELHFQVLANKLANLAQEHPHMVLPKIDIPLEHPHSFSTNYTINFLDMQGYIRVFSAILATINTLSSANSYIQSFLLKTHLWVFLLVQNYAIIAQNTATTLT
jgi:hypothetical protein